MLAIVFILLVLTLLRLCHAIARHRMPCMAEEQGQVRYAPRWMTVMLLLLTPIFLLPLAAMLAGGWQYGLFGWAVLTVLVDLTAQGALWRVQYHAEGFRCRDEWGRIRAYAWQDILGCEKTQVKLGRGFRRMRSSSTWQSDRWSSGTATGAQPSWRSLRCTGVSCRPCARKEGLIRAA